MNSKEKTKYRQSKKWKEKRKDFIDKFDSTCQFCGKRYTGKSKRLLQIHHIDPSTYGREKDKDLVVLCSNCHRYLERLYKIVKGKTSLPNEWYSIFNKIIERFFI